jgi:P4 family phage/plasmid primase-like protien
MLNIPKQLQDKKFRFIKINPKTKKPTEKDWALDNNYRYNEKEFMQYLKSAKSYGVVCGFGNLAIVDIENIDDKSVANLVMQHKFPETFTVQTGSGGWHLYYFVKDINKRIRITTDEQHYGEIQSKGNQCLGAGSVHPSGTNYAIINDSPITTVTKKQLLDVLKGYIAEDKDKSKFVDNSITGLNWNISKLLKYCPDLKTKDDVKFQGSHPTHGSTGGQNFEIDLDKNTWYCFRCECGGDAINLIAMLEGLVKCTDACPSKQKFREIFKEAKKLGIKKYGFKSDDYKPSKQKIQSTDKCPDLFVCNNKGRIIGKNIERVVEWFIARNPTVAIESMAGKGTHIYVYRDGYYRIDGQNIIRAFIKKQFKLQNQLWTSGYENEIINYIMTFNVKSRKNFSAPKKLINCGNVTYDLERPNKPLEHSPEHNFLYKIPWNYSKKNKKLTPELRNYFLSTFDNNKEIINLVQELFGYCLYSGYPFAGIFYLYGTGGNGKKVFTALLEALLGEDNVASESLNSLVSRRFSTAQLYGKLLNSCGELSSKTLQESDLLKSLSSGDRITAEFKGLDGFTFLNVAKIVTACNAIPNAYDTSYGWYDRQIVIPFIRKFRYSKEEDTNLIEKLTTKKNMESLLSWAIEGLHRLLKNNGFTYPSNREEIYKMYQGNAKYFVSNFYTRSKDYNNYVKVEDIRKDYLIWCKKNNIPEDSEVSLGKAFRYFELPSAECITQNNKKIYVRYGLKKVN